MIKLEHITPEQLDELLHNLDVQARDYDSYEYGLPIANKVEVEAMRYTIFQWLARLESHQQELSQHG